MDIVDIANLRGYLAQTVRAVNDAIWDIRGERGEGIQVQMPSEIKVDVTVVFDWQPADLELRASTVEDGSEKGQTTEVSGGGTNNSGTDKQTGETKETSEAQEDAKKTSSMTKTSTNTNAHTQSDAENVSGSSE